MSRSPLVAQLVAELVGSWSGGGSGDYPTIEAFRYREKTSFTPRDDHPALLFEQRTWRQTSEDEVPSHWETGLMRLHSDETVRFTNAQGGRGETMIGSWAGTDGVWEIRLSSTGFSGDDRVVGASRLIRVGGDRLDYEMYMETTTTHEMSLHLKGSLTRHP